MFEYIFSFIAPHLCIGCRVEGSLLCTDCQNELPSFPFRCYLCRRKAKSYICSLCQNQTPLDKLIVTTAYQDAARQLIHCLKFGRASAGAQIIARLMAQKLAELPELPKDTVVTFAPTAAKRIRIRGYDQSQLVAKHLAKDLGLPFRPLLTRTSSTRQLGADKQQRQQQMKHAFTTRPGVIMPKHILLVDDVVTTGATMEAAASMLKHAGGGHVVGVAFAAA